MSANIRIDQGSGAGAGTDGQARTNIWLSQLVELVDVGVGIASTRLWTLDDKPAGSAATMLNSTTSVASFTPDIAGTYKVTLARDGFVIGTNVKTLVIRVTRSNTGAVLSDVYPLPAYLETDAHSEGIAGQGTTGRGYGPLFESFRDGVGAKINEAGALGPQTTLPTTSSTASASFRRYVAPPSVVTPTVVTTHTVEDGTTDGETKTIRRAITNRTRIRFIGEDGKHIAWVNRTMTLQIKWSASETRWLPLSHADNVKVFYPEDFGEGVGVGNATADRAALAACFAAHVDMDPVGSASHELAAKIVLGAMYYVNEGIDLAGTDYTALTVEGASGAGGTGGFRGCGIHYTGPAPAVMSGTPTLTFNRAARTIVRSAGSWLADGFAAGQRIYVSNPPQTSIQNNRIHVIETVNASTITVVAPATTFPTVPFPTDGMLPFTEGPIADFVVVQITNCLRVKGASGVTLRDVVINGNHNALIPLWFDLVPDDPNATNMMSPRVEHCSLYGSYNHALGTVLMFGRPGCNPPVGSDLNNTWVQDCMIQNLYTYPPPLSSGIRYADGNNTKLHRVLKCQIWSGARLIDHESASEGLSVQDTHFENGKIAVYNNGYCEISNCHSERVTQTVYGTRGRCLETNNSWNLSDAVIVSRQRMHKLVSTNYYNGTTMLGNIVINLGTNVVTADNYVSKTPVNGDIVVVRSGTGFDGCPGMLHPTWNDPALQVYFLADVTFISGITYTFTLREGHVAGTVVDFTSQGSDVWIISPSIFETSTGLNKPSADGYFISFDSCIILGAEDLPMTGSSPTQLSMDPFFGYQGVAIARVSVQNCMGFTPGPVFRALQEVAAVPMFGNAQLVPQITYYAENCRWVSRGINGWSTLRIRSSQLAEGTFRAGGGMLLYVDLPWRCGVEAVVSEVITPFAGPGLATAAVKVGHYDVGQGDGNDDDAFLLPTSLMTFANTSDRRKGLLTAEKGARLLGDFGPITYWPKYTGATDWGWLNRYVMTIQIDITGCVFSALTAGDLLIHFKMEQIPDWRRT